MSDAIYISADDVWDINDGFFGRVTHSGEVIASGSYTSILTAPLPGVLPGNYKVIVRSDIRNNLVESNESNNLSASLNSFVIDAAALTLGSASNGTLSPSQFVYYKVTVQTGDTLVINVDSQSSTGSTQLFASFDSIPTLGRSDFRAIDPFEPDQRIIVPIARGGSYYVLVYGADVPSSSTSFSILAKSRFLSESWIRILERLE